MAHRARDASWASRSWIERLPEKGGWPTAAGMAAVNVAVMVVDLGSGSNDQIIQVSVIAVLIVAMVCAVRQTLLVAAVHTTAVVVIFIQERAATSAPTVYAVVVGTVAICAALVVLCMLRQQREALLARTRSNAEAVQRVLLRPFPLRTDDATVDGLYISSVQEALVGGDVYEVLPTPYGTRVLIGDVRGKGLPALQAGMVVLTSFRESAYHQPTLSQVADRLEQALQRHNRRPPQEGAESEDRFVTALLLQLETDRNALIVDCGHVPPSLLAEGTAAEVRIDDPGLPLGLGELAPGPRTEQRIPFAPGDRLALCTDGVTETRDANGADYPLGERLRAWAALPSAQLLNRLQQDLLDYAGHELHDDAAFLVVRRDGL
ncbi:PP2C family protein-serine/threonine phosphatase [Streptomyces sp. RGM 3693]|uniref:PP2C family protein-serine/threonine phosphatase n=1 Tax=Streptomyces sp. RGM 3693 TaxID=3413284 RepID=UPI003D2A22D4